MKAGDKVKVLYSVYEIFKVGEVYTVGYTDSRPYGIFLEDPFYLAQGLSSGQSWPFHREELELLK